MQTSTSMSLKAPRTWSPTRIKTFLRYSPSSAMNAPRSGTISVLLRCLENFQISGTSTARISDSYSCLWHWYKNHRSNHCEVSIREYLGGNECPDVNESNYPGNDDSHPKSKTVGDECACGKTSRRPICDQHAYVHGSNAHIEVPFYPIPSLRVFCQVCLLSFFFGFVFLLFDFVLLLFFIL